MTPEEKEAIRIEIERRLNQAESSLDGLKEQMQPVEPSVAIGRLTRMDAIQQQSMAKANLIKNEESITSLKQALNRLKQDDFGICLQCKQAIGMARILAMPEATHCVRCLSSKKAYR